MQIKSQQLEKKDETYFFSQNQNLLIECYLFFFDFNNHMKNIQQLRKENKKLKEVKSTCQQELQKLKEVGKSHENQIDTLLKFNERLLGIIENEFNAAAKSKISSDLQIISEINEGNGQINGGNKLKSNLASPPKLGNNFQQQDMDGFEDDEEEQEIYNQDKQPDNKANMQSSGNKLLEVPKISKIEKVFELQHKDEEVSINLNTSQQNSTPTSLNKLGDMFTRKQQTANIKKSGKDETDINIELQQLKQMVKEYKQQFVDNSAEYEQICGIIHNDLVGDLQQFRLIEQQSQQFYQQKMQDVSNLRNEIKQFQPASQLYRVMKRLKVSPQTEKLLNQRIISKQL